MTLPDRIADVQALEALMSTLVGSDRHLVPRTG
jgi:hypothetical protein